MMKTKARELIGAICLACASAIVNADDFLDVNPFFKQGELITPMIVSRFLDVDEVPDQFVLSFNVWTAGSNSKRLQTVKRYPGLPAVPCSVPVDPRYDYDVKFYGADSVSRVHMLIDFYVECFDSSDSEFKESHKTMWYSANVNTGSSYIKVWDGWSVIGGNAVDWDDDGTEELMLALARPNPDPASDSTQARVIFMRFSDGTVEAANNYPVEYFF